MHLDTSIKFAATTDWLPVAVRIQELLEAHLTASLQHNSHSLEGLLLLIHLYYVGQRLRLFEL